MTKYSASFAFFIVLVSIVLTGFILLYDARDKVLYRPAPPVTRDLLKKTVVPSVHKQQLEIAEKNLSLLLGRPLITQHRVAKINLAVPPKKKVVRKSIPLPEVSMVYISNTERSAVVDDLFVKEGDSLPNGTRVSKIRPGSVEIVYKGRSYQLKVVPAAM